MHTDEVSNREIDLIETFLGSKSLCKVMVCDEGLVTASMKSFAFEEWFGLVLYILGSLL